MCYNKQSKRGICMENKFIVNMEDNDSFSQFSKKDLEELKTQLSKSQLEYRNHLWFNGDVTIGLEVEYEHVDKHLVNDYVSKNCCYWNSDYDTTLEYGGEIQSPILTGSPANWDELNKICLFLEEHHAVMNENAGGHIHIGSHLLTGNIEYWRIFVKMYMIYEKDLLKFLFGEMNEGRKSFYQYAPPVANILYHELDSLNQCTCFEDLYYQVFPKDRNEAINFENVSIIDGIKRLRNTIEFRSPNASSKAIIWQNNVNTLVKFLLSVTKEEIDGEYLDYLLKEEPSTIPSLEDTLQFIDMIFDNNQDKIYFLKQYLKEFNWGKRLSRGLVKTMF